MHHDPLNRRQFLHLTSLAAGGFILSPPRTFAAAKASSSLVASIEKIVLRQGPEKTAAWFHPRACMIPGPNGPVAFMTLQTIMGSDYFGPVHWMESPDRGRTWTEPQPVPALGRVKLSHGGDEGVCDVVPDYHARTRSVLAMGHNVFYNGPRFHSDQPPRWPVYSVWRNGAWGPRRKLEWNDPRGRYIYSNGCSQRVMLPGGDILLTFAYASESPKIQPLSVSVSGVLCSFDGETLAVKEVGEAITHDKGRGLMEPSLTQFGGRFLMTIRAEDERGYVTTSTDGLRWAPKQAWSWDNGEPLTMYRTQQHWLTHSNGLFLVYNRKDPSNEHVSRWRAPLYLAQVDPKTLRLQRATERIVFPLVGDVIREPGRPGTYDMGNFHTVNVSPDESWVTVGEWRPKNANVGELLLGRVRWNQPNRLAPV